MLSNTRFQNDASRHPAPTSTDLGLLCLRAIIIDPHFSSKVKDQARALETLLEPQHLTERRLVSG